MMCSEVRKHLSTYYDSELAAPLRAKIVEHIGGCLACHAELDGFRELSELSAQLRSPTPPAGMWEDLERQLDTRKLPTSFSSQRVPRRVAVLAVILLVAAAIGLILRFLVPGHDTDEVQNQSIARFVQEFNVDPTQAQMRLVEQYEGQPLEAENAVQGLRYTPVGARAAPVGYKVQKAFVLKMPCCKCVQTIFARDGGGSIAVFEHDEGQPTWFGTRPAITASCNGNPTTLVEVDTGLAATWKCGARCITVIGATDVNEVVQLMAALDASAADDRRTNSPSS